MSVGLIKYKRVTQRLREIFNDEKFTVKDIENAIFLECGTDPRTVKAALERLLRLDLIKEITQKREFGVHLTRKFELPLTQDEMF